MGCITVDKCCFLLLGFETSFVGLKNVDSDPQVPNYVNKNRQAD